MAPPDAVKDRADDDAYGELDDDGDAEPGEGCDDIGPIVPGATAADDPITGMGT
jgi:hypothetical protein